MKKHFVTLPVEPTKKILEAIVVEEYPEDYEIGKETQRRLGLGVVPPNAEMEVACGKYDRMIKPYLEMDFAELERCVLVDLINQLTDEQKGKLKRLFGSANPNDLDDGKLGGIIHIIDRTLMINKKEEGEGKDE